MATQSPQLPQTKYWLAKTTPDNQPGCTVREHCRWVGALAEAIRDRLPKIVRDLIPPETITLAACHDVGKISPGFFANIFNTIHKANPDFGKDDPAAQFLIQAFLDVRYETSHEATGMKALKETIGCRWSKVVGRHHGNNPGLPMEKENDVRFGGPD